MSSHLYDHKILILNYGSQYTQLIARRIRQIGVYCEIHPGNGSTALITAFNPTGIILSGGPNSVTETDSLRIDQQVFEQGCPILGICYGMQAMAIQLGGQVESSTHHEYGHAPIKVQHDSPLFADIPTESDVWMSHGDRVELVPEGFEILATSSHSPVAAMGDVDRQWYGLQFHPEVSHTQQGEAMLRHFIVDICQCACQWDAKHILDEQVERIRSQVGREKVLLGLSGGVDSAVAAALLQKAIGDQLVCVFVDNGLLRQGEVAQVMDTFKDFGVHIVLSDAKSAFLTALRGIEDPETKRKIIGHEFVEAFKREAAKLEDVQWLAQGTIYPDVVESGGAMHAEVIKSHHNVGGLPKDLPLKLIEPLRELFKDEVRAVGLELGLPKPIVLRHPFPGPGLAIRIIGAVNDKDLELLQRCDEIFITALHEYDLYDRVQQAFTVLLPIRSVGVTGDSRRYGRLIAIRAVQTTDFMTAVWAELPNDFLGEVSRRLTNHIPEITRVVYDISSKPPATIEWE